MKQIRLYTLTLFQILICVLLTQISIQSSYAHENERLYQFPDIPGYKTLLCDFHMHTVFSDGDVWPTIRVHEALKEGLDAISITDHLEYQPHEKDIAHPDRNRSYQIALDAAQEHDLIIINGAEITRDMPPGHANAIFLKDANKLIKEDVFDVFREAKRQGAFIFWNHPHWIAHKPDGIAELMEMHHQLINDGLLDGIEIVNDVTYSNEAMQIALDQNLTIMGNSDIHGLVDWSYKLYKGGHRPLTLVFAEDKSEESIKEGLESGRTAVWFNESVIGKSEFLIPLIEHSLLVKRSYTMKSYTGESSVQAVEIENKSSTDYILENLSDFSLHSHADVFTIKTHGTETVGVMTLKKMPEFELCFKVLNAVVAPNTHPEINLKIHVNDD